MASVTSLDGDLRRMRLDKYTPGAVREARSWIEDILGEQLAPGDLLEALKDGVALCRLANMAIPPPGIRFKKSAMPFVQMENISHFLRACQAPPLNLQQHDTFLTVDLYEAKDPAQVLQCLGAFSRAANKANPSAFPSAIGARPGNSANAPASPSGRGATPGAGRPMPSIYSSRTPLAPTQTGESVSGRWSPTKDERSPSPSKSPTSTSSWSKRELEGATSPAWNIAQYGYMGGASQGNLGISFGGRRQITSAGPSVPNATQKERLRKEREAEELRAKQLMEEEERRRRAELEAEEENARREEQLRWEEETERQRIAEKRKVEEEKRKWEEEERQWKLTEEARKREEEEAEARLAEERQQRLRSSNSNKSSSSAAAGSEPKLHGQFLSQYQAEASSAATPSQTSTDPSSAYTSRVRELEKELELARQREQAYEQERQGRSQNSPAIGTGLGVDALDTRTRSRSRGARSRSRPRALPNLASPPVRQESWSRNDKEILVTPRSRSRHRFADVEPRPQEEDEDRQPQYQSSQPLPPKSPRPLPDPRNHFQQPQQTQQSQAPQLPPRQQAPLPQPPQSPPHARHQAQPEPAGPPSIFQKIRTHRTGEKTAPSTENAAVPSSPLTKSQGRPLPDPSAYASPPRSQKELPVPQKQPLQEIPPQPTYSRELLGGGVAEHDAEDRRRRQLAYNQQKPQQPQPQQQQPQPLAKQRPRGPFGGGAAPQSPASTTSSTPGGGASRPGKSLLEREMEMERQRQREWEEAQRATAAAPRQADNVEGIDGRWDVNQWGGFTGGDSQNRGSQGIGSGRRQIVGPRPLPGQR